MKDQASCGSCWSFGSVGTLEGTNFLATGQMVPFSEQALVDCSWGYGNNGCDGGEDYRLAFSQDSKIRSCLETSSNNVALSLKIILDNFFIGLTNGYCVTVESQPLTLMDPTWVQMAFVTWMTQQVYSFKDRRDFAPES